MAQAVADIAVISPHATSLYLDDRRAGDGLASGGELQTFYLARSLAASGYSVAHMVFDDQRLPTVRNGVLLARLPPRSSRPNSANTGPRRMDLGCRGRNTRELVAGLARMRPRLIIQRNA